MFFYPHLGIAGLILVIFIPGIVNHVYHVQTRLYLNYALLTTFTCMIKALRSNSERARASHPVDLIDPNVKLVVVVQGCLDTKISMGQYIATIL